MDIQCGVDNWFRAWQRTFDVQPMETARSSMTGTSLTAAPWQGLAQSKSAAAKEMKTGKTPAARSAAAKKLSDTSPATKKGKSKGTAASA